MNAYSQTITEKIWQAEIGRPDTIDWSASYIDDDQNIIICGNTIAGSDRANILTSKYEPDGDLIWQAQYNHSFNDADYGTAVVSNDSGHVYVCGAALASFSALFDYAIIKYDENGNELWVKNYNGPGNSYDVPTCLILDASMNLYVSGTSYGSGSQGDFYTIKYDPAGNEEWNARYDYNDLMDVPIGMNWDASGNLVVTGASESSAGTYDYAELKYNAGDGTQISANRTTYGLGNTRPLALVKDSEGNTIVTGYTSHPTQGKNVRTMKMDEEFTILWTKHYNLNDLNDEGVDLEVAENGEIYVCGYATNEDGVKEALLLKYQANGTLAWERRSPAMIPELDAEHKKITKRPWGDIFTAGTINNGSNKDFRIQSYSKDGYTYWEEIYNGTGDGDDVANFIKADSTDYLYVGGLSVGDTSTAYLLQLYDLTEFILPENLDTVPEAYAFYENRGQIVDNNDSVRNDILFYTHTMPTMFLMDDTLSIAWSQSDSNLVTPDTAIRINLHFENSLSSSLRPHGKFQQGFKNYYLAHCPTGITQVKGYPRLHRSELYPKVDLIYSFNDDGLAMSFIIKPSYSLQSDSIIMAFPGSDSIHINMEGQILLKTSLGDVLIDTPQIYQLEANGAKSELSWGLNYLKSSDNQLSFTNWGTYDNSKALLIHLGQPSMSAAPAPGGNVCWSTLYGAEALDVSMPETAWYSDAVTDIEEEGNNLYICGMTTTPLFLATLGYTNDFSGANDAFIQKFEGNLKPLFGTYIGGSAWEGMVYEWFGDPFIPSVVFDFGYPKIARLYDDLILAGNTFSADFPTLEYLSTSTDDFIDDEPLPLRSFIARFNDWGGVLWSSYFGSEHTYIYDIGVNSDNEIYICGRSDGNESGDSEMIPDPDDGIMPFVVLSSESYIKTANAKGFIAALFSASKKIVIVE